MIRRGREEGKRVNEKCPKGDIILGDERVKDGWKKCRTGKSIVLGVPLCRYPKKAPPAAAAAGGEWSEIK